MDNKEEGVDFSHFNTPTNQQPSIEEPSIQPLPVSTIKVTKRLWILGAVLILLALAQVLIFIISKPKDKSDVPPGYEIVKPQYGPIRVEKVSR